MSPELTKQLYDKFPDLFKEKDLPPEQSNMYWGFQCSDGWYNIIYTLCCLIQIHQKSLEGGKYHHQLNEKKNVQTPL